MNIKRAAIATLLVLAPAISLGQANLTVTVSDAATGDEIAGANVCLLDNGAVVAEETTGDTGGNLGRVRFTQVADGSYQLKTDAAGYVGDETAITIAGSNLSHPFSLSSGNPDDGPQCDEGGNGIPYPPEDPSIYVPPGVVGDDTLGNPDLSGVIVDDGGGGGGGDGPLETQLYEIEAGLAHDFAVENGWSFNTVGAVFLFSACHIWSTEGSAVGDPGATVLTLEARRSFFGWLGGTTHCTYFLFGGRELNQGWTFESYTVHLGQDFMGEFADGCTDFGAEEGGAQVMDRPAAGDTDILLGIMITSDDSCRAEVESLVLRGPPGLAWTEAFRRQ